MDFLVIVESVLRENNVAGGASSAFGSGVVSTSTAQSGDNYAPKDSRIPKSLYGSVLSRFGPTGSKFGSKSQKKRKKRKQWI